MDIPCILDNDVCFFLCTTGRTGLQFILNFSVETYHLADHDLPWPDSSFLNPNFGLRRDPMYHGHQCSAVSDPGFRI
jgi:hypothetical protein